jgi:hypothetical protein
MLGLIERGVSETRLRRTHDPGTRRDALRKARRPFTALGATARAEQVARETGRP